MQRTIIQLKWNAYIQLEIEMLITTQQLPASAQPTHFPHPPHV
jgi:hypothetical protein